MTKALLPSRLQLTTTAVLALLQTTARRITSKALVQNLHAVLPTVAVSICPFSTRTPSYYKHNYHSTWALAYVDFLTALHRGGSMRRSW